MGQGLSLEAFELAHIRIYRNILSIQTPSTRVQMIQTCLSGPEYVAAAKRAGVYSFLLQYVNAVNMGRQPNELPSAAFYSPLPAPIIQTRNSQSQVQSQQQPAPQRNQVVQYQEQLKPSWQQITETPKQKAVNYFSSCLEVLGIQDEVALTPQALKIAYKKAALQAHPDKGGNDQLFEAVTRAYAYLNEILLRIQGGREKGLKEVTTPDKIKDDRADEAQPWQHNLPQNLLKAEQSRPQQQQQLPTVETIQPIQLNAKNLDMNAFNRMFEQTHMPDPDSDGYGDWLKTEGTQNTPKFSGKFNRDVFNNAFEEQSRTSSTNPNTLMLHPNAMALAMAPQMGTELGRGRPDTYTAASNDKFKFTDLRDAYDKEATFSGQVANVKVDNRSIEQYRASRERAPDPYSSQEMELLSGSEQQLRQREELRQRRKAEQDVAEANYFNRMRQLVITNH